MKLGSTTKQPVEKFSYTVSYKDALTENDNVKSATAISEPFGLEITNVGVFDPDVKFWLAGGVSGTNYKVVLTVHTDDGRVFQDDLIVKVKDM
jgi:hypothetical protein